MDELKKILENAGIAESGISSHTYDRCIDSLAKLVIHRAKDYYGTDGKREKSFDEFAIDEHSIEQVLRQVKEDLPIAIRHALQSENTEKQGPGMTADELGPKDYYSGGHHEKPAFKPLD